MSKKKTLISSKSYVAFIERTLRELGGVAAKTEILRRIEVAFGSTFGPTDRELMAADSRERDFSQSTSLAKRS